MLSSLGPGRDGKIAAITGYCIRLNRFFNLLLSAFKEFLICKVHFFFHFKTSEHGLADMFLF